MFGLRPHDPAEARVDQAELVPGRADRMHARQPEVPHEVGIEERRDERARGAVHVDRHVEPRSLVQVVERAGELLDGLVDTVVRDAEDRHHADRVLVHRCQHPLSGQVGLLLRDGHVPGLDVPIVRELLPDHLHRGAEDDVGCVGRSAGRLPTLLPAALQGEAGEHARLRGADRGGADRGVRLRRVPEVGEDVHAPLLDGRGLRVLVLVDHVLIERFRVQLGRLGLHPGRDECRQVLAGVAVQQELVVDDLVGGVGLHLALGDPPTRNPLLTFAREERVHDDVVRSVRTYVTVLRRRSLVHGAPSGSIEQGRVFSSSRSGRKPYRRVLEVSHRTCGSPHAIRFRAGSRLRSAGRRVHGERIGWGRGHGAGGRVGFDRPDDRRLGPR